MRRTIIILSFFMLAVFPVLVQATAQSSISGRVVDEESRQGVADVEVKADLETAEFRTVTDGDGRYTVPDLKPGTYQLQFRSPLMQHVAAVEPQLKITVPEGKAAQAPEFLFPRGGTLGGIILSEKKGIRQPLAEATVDFAIAKPRPAWGVRSGSEKTNYKGTFAFRGLPTAKECVITVKVKGHTDLRKVVTIKPGRSVDDLRFVVPWDDQAGIMGAVRNTATGRMLPGVPILVKNTAGDIAGRVETDEHGEYSLVGLAPGRYTAEARWPGAKELSEPVTIERERTTTVIFEYGAAGNAP